MTIENPQCYTCRYYKGKMKCAAFDKIPKQILVNLHDHRKPYTGDKGILYANKNRTENA